MSNNGIDIVGLGVVSGYGWGRETFWGGLSGGKPAARLIGGYGEDKSESAWLALVPEGGDPDDGEGLYGRSFMAAAREAVADARARGWIPGARVGVISVGCFNDMYGWTEFSSGRASRSRDFVRVLPSTPVSMFMHEFGFHGPSMMVSATCASTNNALLIAKLWLDADKVDDVVVVAADLSFTPEIVSGFTRLGAAAVDIEPLEACRPFQDGGKGFGPGEAAVGFVMSSRQLAGFLTVSRATPYAALLGGAMTSDAHHATGMDPSHAEVIRCVAEAIDDARVDPTEVRYLNAHGTGTKQCTDAETHFLDEVFGADIPHIYALKPLVGHCLAGAGAIELAGTLMGYERKQVPASRIVSAGHHPRLLDGLTPLEGGLTLKTSMGMGGYNSAVVVGPAAAI
jgi:3-oxoacyl-[acyl-carrier-protein] synthase II